MIWGSTNAEKDARIKALAQWRPWFAWHPVQTIDGRWAWLRTVERRGQYVWADYPVWVWDYCCTGDDHG